MPRTERTFRWVGEEFWRDWVFWTGLLIALATLLALRVAEGPVAWWRYPVTLVVCTGIAIGVLGFFREAVRGYRGTSD